MKGKFYRNAGRFYVSCYREDETPERLAMVSSANVAIEKLARDFHVSV